MANSNKHRNRSSMAETTPFDDPIYGLPQTNLRRQYQQQNPQTYLLNQEAHFYETLESSFSRLNVNPGSDGEFFDRSSTFDDLKNDCPITGLGFSSLALQEMEHTNQDSSVLNLQDSDRNSFGFMGLQGWGLDGFMPGSYSTANNFSQLSPYQNGLFGDFGNAEFKSEFLAVPSSEQNLFSNQNLFLNGVVPKNQNGSRSSLNFKKRQWLQEPFDCLSLGNLRGNIVALAKDQYGYRFLQKTMSLKTKEEIEMIFLELIDHVSELIIDQFGNFVVQKLVEICSDEQRTRILLMLTKFDSQLVTICVDMHGTRAVQKLLEHLTTPQQISLVTAALSPGIVRLTNDINGHHVIQHCLKYFSEEDNKYLLNEVANNSYEIATDKSGCCVLQQCVEYSKGPLRERLVAEVIANALLLAEDRYGNYVVQHILGLRVPQITANLLRQLEGHYTPLSCNKYGSNVVEKCLIESGEQQSMRIVMELLRSPNVSMLLIDPFGNYVIQSALLVSKGLVHDALRNLVKHNAPMMRSNIYGKKVLSWFERRKMIHI